jgi:hypothetical protein
MTTMQPNMDGLVTGADGQPVDLHEIAVTAELRKLRERQEARRRLDAENRPALALPPMQPFAEWINRPISPIRYRIDKLQPNHGRAVLAAQFKAGKTTMVSNQLVAVATGDRRAKLHSIKNPCSMCGFPVASGGYNHLSCPPQPAAKSDEGLPQ